MNSLPLVGRSCPAKGGAREGASFLFNNLLFNIDIWHTYLIMQKDLNLRSTIAFGLIFAFLVNTFGPLPLAKLKIFVCLRPGYGTPKSEFNPPILKGIKVHPDNPFRFDFILDKGDGLSNGVIPAKAGILNQEQLKQESTKLIKYFLASLTIPEKDLWVNLSPYEKDRIIPNSFGLTEMGRDLLAEDYMLKQITASLIYRKTRLARGFGNVYTKKRQRNSARRIFP